MAVRQTGSMAYPILDGWWDAARASGDYVDILEIRKGRDAAGVACSAYVTEMGLNPDLEATRAQFTDLGIIAGDTDDGSGVVGFLMGQDETCIDRYKVAGDQVHPLAFQRVYYGASWKRGNESRHVDTQAREIKFVGTVRL